MRGVYRLDWKYYESAYKNGNLKISERNFSLVTNWLNERENNTKEEEKMARLFLKARQWTKIAVVFWICNIIFAILFFKFFPTPSDYDGESAYYISGAYFKDRIIYRKFMNNERGQVEFAKPEELGFSKNELKHNEEVMVYISEDGKILKSVNVTRRMLITLYKRLILVSPIPMFFLLIVIAKICLRTYFKPMVAWIDKLNDGELGYYLL